MKNNSLLENGSPLRGILFGFHSVSRRPGLSMAAELAAYEQALYTDILTLYQLRLLPSIRFYWKSQCKQ
jgi:hypothetical protein